MPIRAGDMLVGAEITIQVDGSPCVCTKVHQGKPGSVYDSSCDGAWFLMKYANLIDYWYATAGQNTPMNYANSDAHRILNGQFIERIEPRIKNAIKQVKIPYCSPTLSPLPVEPGVVAHIDQDLTKINSGSTGLTTKLFLLSGVEFGVSNEDMHCKLGITGEIVQVWPYEGNKLDAFKAGQGEEAGRIRRSLMPTVLAVATRSPIRSNMEFGNTRGWEYGPHYKSLLGWRTTQKINFSPAFILPSDFTFPGSTVGISGSNRNLGTFTTTAPSASYTITDPGNFAQTVTEKLNGTVLRTYNAVLGREETATIPADKWLETLNGDYTLTITATDVDGMEVTRIFTFKKAMNTLEFSTKEAIQADEMPIKAILNVQGAMPQGSIFKAEICNNGNDAAPAWEDVTESVKSGEKFFFKNKLKTAEKWGVKVRISLQRGTATGPCYIQSVGGNFD